MGPINSCIENNVRLRLRNSRVCMSTLCVHDSVYVRELLQLAKVTELSRNYMLI